MDRWQNVSKVIFVTMLLFGLWRVVGNWSVVTQIDSKPDIPRSPKLEKYLSEIFDEFSYSDLTTQAKELYASEHLHLIDIMEVPPLEFLEASKPNLWFLLVKNVEAKPAARSILEALSKLGEIGFVRLEDDSSSYDIYVGPILDFRLAETKKIMVDQNLGVESRIYLYAREFSS